MFCKNCGSEVSQNAAVCMKCGFSVNDGENYCCNCGQKITPGAAVCVNCGTAVKNIVSSEQKSRVAAGLLGIFLGAWGVHNFYLGYQNKAVIQLVVGVVGLFLTCGIATTGIAIWGLVEGIMILTGSINVDGKGVPLKD